MSSRRKAAAPARMTMRRRPEGGGLGVCGKRKYIQRFLCVNVDGRQRAVNINDHVFKHLFRPLWCKDKYETSIVVAAMLFHSFTYLVWQY